MTTLEDLKRVHNEAVRAEVANALAKSGGSLRGAAAIMGCSHQRLQAICERMGLEWNRRRNNKDNNDQQ